MNLRVCDYHNPTRQRGIAISRFESISKNPSLTRRVGIIPFFAPLIFPKLEHRNFKARQRGIEFLLFDSISKNGGSFAERKMTVSEGSEGSEDSEGSRPAARRGGVPPHLHIDDSHRMETRPGLASPVTKLGKLDDGILFWFDCEAFASEPFIECMI